MLQKYIRLRSPYTHTYPHMLTVSSFPPAAQLILHQTTPSIALCCNIHLKWMRLSSKHTHIKNLYVLWGESNSLAGRQTRREWMMGSPWNELWFLSRIQWLGEGKWGEDALRQITPHYILALTGTSRQEESFFICTNLPGIPLRFPAVHYQTGQFDYIVIILLLADTPTWGQGLSLFPVCLAFHIPEVVYLAKTLYQFIAYEFLNS